MADLIKRTIAYTLMSFFVILILGSLIAVIYDDINERRTSTFLVPDPIAAKEGEMQWLTVPGKDVSTMAHDHLVEFSVNGETYRSSLYIQKFNK